MGKGKPANWPGYYKWADQWLWVARADKVLKSGDLSAAEKDFVMGVKNRKQWCLRHPKRLEYFLDPDAYLKFADIEKRVARERENVSE